jgi:hypothetical protein
VASHAIEPQSKHRTSRRTTSQVVWASACVAVVAALITATLASWWLRPEIVRPGGTGSGLGQAVALTQSGEPIRPWLPEEVLVDGRAMSVTDEREIGNPLGVLVILVPLAVGGRLILARRTIGGL